MNKPLLVATVFVGMPACAMQPAGQATLPATGASAVQCVAPDEAARAASSGATHCTADAPVAGRVACPAGCMAQAGMPTKTVATSSGLFI